jgi:hypothetical protein
MKDGSARPGGRAGGRGLDHSFHSQDIQHPFQIVGGNRQAHLRFHHLQPPGQEIPLVHTAFHRAKRTLDDPLSTPHLLRMKTVPAFHVVQDPFFGSPGDPAAAGFPLRAFRPSPTTAASGRGVIVDVAP